MVVGVVVVAVVVVVVVVESKVRVRGTQRDPFLSISGGLSAGSLALRV